MDKLRQQLGGRVAIDVVGQVAQSIDLGLYARRHDSALSRRDMRRMHLDSNRVFHLDDCNSDGRRVSLQAEMITGLTTILVAGRQGGCRVISIGQPVYS